MAIMGKEGRGGGVGGRVSCRCEFTHSIYSGEQSSCGLGSALNNLLTAIACHRVIFSHANDQFSNKLSSSHSGCIHLTDVGDSFYGCLTVFHSRIYVLQQHVAGKSHQAADRASWRTTSALRSPAAQPQEDVTSSCRTSSSLHEPAEGMLLITKLSIAKPMLGVRHASPAACQPIWRKGHGREAQVLRTPP